MSGDKDGGIASDALHGASLWRCEDFVHGLNVSYAEVEGSNKMRLKLSENSWYRLTDAIGVVLVLIDIVIVLFILFARDF